jgi:hypothetical protein
MRVEEIKARDVNVILRAEGFAYPIQVQLTV